MIRLKPFGRNFTSGTVFISLHIQLALDFEFGFVPFMGAASFNGPIWMMSTHGSFSKSIL
jgi:hypothetical protein